VARNRRNRGRGNRPIITTRLLTLSINAVRMHTCQPTTWPYRVVAGCTRPPFRCYSTQPRPPLASFQENESIPKGGQPGVDDNRVAITPLVEPSSREISSIGPLATGRRWALDSPWMPYYLIARWVCLLHYWCRVHIDLMPIPLRSFHNRGIKPKPVVGIILSLETPQLFQPPRLVPVSCQSTVIGWAAAVAIITYPYIASRLSSPNA
jgi:hypothetical protein